MSNKYFYVFKETVCFTFMVNCFTASHIKLSQDFTLVILFNKINTLYTQTLDLFEGCL